MDDAHLLRSVSRRAFVQKPDGAIETIQIDRVGIAVEAGGEQLTNGYSWDEWSTVTWHERRKGNWQSLQDAFIQAASR